VKRREFIALLGGAAIAERLVAGAAHAQTDFPNRHIHMVVPHGPCYFRYFF
jgi:tripartite-type tricarboxylate transporter receptor subunit TctC